MLFSHFIVRLISMTKKTDSRFAIGIFIRGIFPWDEDPAVNEDVIVCPFLNSTNTAQSTYRPCTKGYRLHCSYNNFQLFNAKRADTFVFITRPPVQSGVDLATSIALQKISSRVQQVSEYLFYCIHI